MLRLTLRTLLAYLDDSLDAPQAKAIGKKIAESETATELIDRIRKVTRKRRLTAPPESGPGASIDANTVAAFLDNDMSPEQQGEFEHICMSSDFHLAEVAACHQILTLVLTEPATVPPTAKERMYQLAKGPEAVERKAPKKEKAPDVVPADDKDADEKIRMGLPVFSKAKSSKWVFVGGGILAACLLVFVVWQILNWSAPNDTNPTPLANADAKKKDPAKKEPEVKKKEPEIKKKEPEIKKKEPEVKKKEPEIKKKEPEVKKKDPNPKQTGETPFAPPAPGTVVVGNFEPVAGTTDNVLLQQDQKKNWQRLNVRNTAVVTNRLLVSLPGCRSVVTIRDSIRLTLWGQMPEVWVFRPPVLYESVVVLHPSNDFDLDLTLKRGRIILGNLRQDRPSRVRLRLDDPTNATPQYFDFKFETPGSEIMAELSQDMPPNEPFYKDPDDPKRAGPYSMLSLLAKNGEIFVNRDNLGFRLTAPPSPSAFYMWHSVQGDNGPHRMDMIPKALDNPPVPPTVDKNYRRDMLKAVDDFGAVAGSKAVETLMTEWLKSSPVNHDARRHYAVRCMASLGKIDDLLDTLENPKFPRVRREAVDAIRRWMAMNRNNEYVLYDKLQKKYNSTTQAERMMDLLHYYSKEALQSPDTYQALINLLDDSQMVVRELAYWHLWQLVPAGRSIRYSASAESVSRQQAQAAWRKIIPPGKLPPAAQ